MKKFFAAAILLMALLIGDACAEKIPTPEKSYDPDSTGATDAPDDINHPDSIYYSHADFQNMISTADRIILTNYPTCQQMTDYSCGPCAALTVLYYFGNRDFDEATLVKAMKTKPIVGTTLGNMVKFFRELGWNVQSSLDRPPLDEFEFQKFVIRNLSAGRPIIVENVEWGGHWRVIIGVDTMGTEDLSDDVLIFADSFDTSDHHPDGYAIGSLDRFFAMWFDHSMLPKKERNQPWLIATPKNFAP